MGNDDHKSKESLITQPSLISLLRQLYLHVTQPIPSGRHRQEVRRTPEI